jgi:hypothetical protein
MFNWIEAILELQDALRSLNRRCEDFIGYQFTQRMNLAPFRLDRFHELRSHSFLNVCE